MREIFLQMNKELIYRFSISLLLTVGLAASGVFLQKAGSKLFLASDPGVTLSSPFIDESKGPKLVLSEDVWDFGEVEENRQTIHTVFIKNWGNEDLVIKKSRSSCGCTVGIVEEKIIPPGGQTKLGISFIGEPEEVGKRVQKYIYIHSNDLFHPIKSIKIVGRVKPRA